MSGTPGRNFRVKVSPTAGGAGVYTAVADINSCSMNDGRTTLDVTAFGDNDVARAQGLKDCSFELGGFYNSADTNGQNAIRSAYENGTELWIQFLPNGTAGFKKQVLISKFSVSSTPSGTNDLSITADGTGASAAV